ncbi:LysR family transcriptional regulator [Sphingomonas sp. Leaf339]|uniref:LysR family transcriptional regulator n=1 Tax=Sphingomonas sp. Leaf339 TaxID=1736343 RepID=UPI0006F80D9D|nr:LysR family transcriptional regulator [Sphingomonas sp. Leaf339]KQU53104.1 LysR family transcriptional regulator [Sphingomonas sp. Leaf339]
MIDRYLLRYFLSVVDHGNFSRAAGQCGVSQPTLSVGIAKLEGLLGRPLFIRSNRRVELTAAGTRFATHARRIELEFAEAERAVADDRPAPVIRLGVIPTLPTAWIEQAVAAAVGAPERLELVEGRMRELGPMLDRGRIDAVLGLVDGTPVEPLFTERYALALPVDHPLATREQIGADEVAGETMLVRRQCEALPAISRFFTSRGVRPFMAARTTSDDRALAYVRAGLGITVMPRGFAGAGIAMPFLTGFTATRAIGIRTDRDGAGRLRDSEAFARFEGAIRAVACAIPGA